MLTSSLSSLDLLRPLALGGVTRHVLRTMTMPVLLSHQGLRAMLLAARPLPAAVREVVCGDQESYC